MTHPAVLLVAHGTRSTAGRAVVDELTALVAARLPEAEVNSAYVDVQTPLIGEAVAAEPAGRAVVVVPLLLSRGYHVLHDVGVAVSRRPGTVATTPLGPDAALRPVLLDRLAEAGATPDEPCVLVGAGSRFAQASADVAEMAQLLAAARPGPVTVGYCAAASPSVAQALAGAGPGSVTALPYMLAPGHFLSTLAQSGATRVAEPLGADPRVADLVRDRARQGLRAIDSL